MALKKVSWTDGGTGTVAMAGQRLARLAVVTVDEISAFYAAMAKILIGRVEDFTDFAASRRLRHLNLVAVKQQVSAAKAPRPRR